MIRTGAPLSGRRRLRKALPMNLGPRTALALAACALTLALGADSQAQPPSRAKIAVLPLVPLDASIKSGAGETLRDLMAAELDRQSPDPEVARGARFGACQAEAVPLPADDAGAEAALASARAELKVARRHAAAGSLDAAIEAFGASIALMEASLPAIEGSAALAEARASLALALFQRGRDAAAKASLDRAILLSPDAPLAEEATSPRLAQMVERRRAEMARQAEARLAIGAVPPGARVEVNGRLLGRAPLCVQGLPPGTHLVRAWLPTAARPLARLIDVQSAAQVEFRLPRGTPLASLLDRLAENRLDAAALADALEVAAAHGASQVIGGVLSTSPAADGAPAALRLDAFVIDVRAPAVHLLPAQTFDSELLSAGIEMAALVRALVETGVALGEAAALPAALRTDWPPARLPCAEVHYGPIQRQAESAGRGAGADSSGAQADRPAARRPIDPRKAAGALRPRQR